MAEARSPYGLRAPQHLEKYAVRVALAAGLRRMQHNRRAKPAGRESGFHLHGALRPEGVRTVIPQLSSAHFSAATLPPQRASGPPLRECWSCPQRRWSSKINLANVLRPNVLFCPSHRGDADPLQEQGKCVAPAPYKSGTTKSVPLLGERGLGDRRLVSRWPGFCMFSGG